MAAVASVLLVEPDVDSRAMYAEAMRHAGIRPMAVGTAAAALRRAEEVDLIVTGIRLRGKLDGVELIDRLRQHRKTHSIPIVVVTASVSQTERDRALSAGCDVFLPKPCLPSELLMEVHRLLALPRTKGVRGKRAVVKADLPRRQSRHASLRKK